MINDDLIGSTWCLLLPKAEVNTRNKMVHIYHLTVFWLNGDSGYCAPPLHVFRVIWDANFPTPLYSR